jgi:ribose transport system substrate-binding protein
LVETLTRGFGVPVWIRSSVETMNRLREAGRSLVMATVDLGEGVAVDLVKGGLVTCIAAAQTVILSRLARPVPAGIALPGLRVTRHNVVDGFQTIWRQPAPREVFRVLGLAG